MIFDLIAMTGSQAESAWTPAQLFQNGEKGLWLDGSDYSTMFQDSAGTTPVTGTGQVVGLWVDKSGSGNNVSQTTVSAKPITNTIGGRHYVLFDGVNDNLTRAASNPTGTDGITGCCGAYFSSVGGANVVYASWTGNVAFRLEPSASITSIVLSSSVAASNLVTFPRSIVALGYGRATDIPATVVLDGISTSGSTPSGRPINGSINIPSATNILTLNVGQFVIINRQLTALEKQQLVDYVTLKS